MVYTPNEFKKDLAQLGGMLSKFYQETHKNTKKGGGSMPLRYYKPVAKMKGGDISVRKFKVTKVNGKEYPFYRRYKGKEPKDAARKAGRFVCGKLKMNKNCIVTFELKETTRGSDKRVYGPYKGKFEKLPKPRKIGPLKKKDPKTGKIKTFTHTQTHKFIVMKEK